MQRFRTLVQSRLRCDKAQSWNARRKMRRWNYNDDLPAWRKLETPQRRSERSEGACKCQRARRGKRRCNQGVKDVQQYETRKVHDSQQAEPETPILRASGKSH